MNTLHFGFSIFHPDDEKAIADVSEMNELLESFGISIYIKPYRDMDNMGYLGINIDTDTLEKIKTRNAGRKVNYNKSQNYNCCPTIGEVIEWKKTMTHQQIIDKIGCPRATYYRRWKELKGEFGDDLSGYGLDMSWQFIW